MSKRHRPDHHHHHHPHSGSMVEYHDTYAGDTINHYHQASQSALQTCLQAVRSLNSPTDRERLIGQLLGLCVHEHLVRGLMRSIELAQLSVNHYATDPHHRDY